MINVYPGLRGPTSNTDIVAPPRTELSQFDRGGDHRLAVLVTDPQSGWLGLIRGLQAHGVPFTVTRDVSKALRHKVVLAYPIISGRVLSGDDIRALAQHVRSGGTVVAFNLAGGGLSELFGVGEGREGATRTRMTWSAPAATSQEATIVVSSRGESRVQSVGYAPGSARVLARFEDGSVAASCRTVVGQACVLGVDLGSLAQRALNGRAESMARSYVNAYEPSLDSLFWWIRDLYVAGEPTPWLVSTVPAGKVVSILLTHDVDYGPSMDNAPAYAEVLRARGLRGTFFVQTKYMKDYNDRPFFDAAAIDDVRALVDQGMEVGSHTVAHSGAFEMMPMGSGRERYPQYRPFVESVSRVRGASVLGELRVSKFLLERLVGARVVSFRPGRLSYPFSLPQALQATGYSYSSSITANTVLSHLPFQMTHDRADGALQPIFEFPVTIEDEAGAPLGQRFDAANVVIEKIAREHGVATILIHPNIIGHKLEFEARLVDHWKDRAWLGSVDDFGDWWAARDALEVDVTQRGAGSALEIRAPRKVSGVEIILPKSGGRRVGVNLPAGGQAAVALP
ncbi:polysaccharide deacetylase family protein [Caulobacter sp. DWR1-3-2b1]|uniref:polysaccharide deacetylase family protein n=1 Tax=Caulobacter sp. DWR1-3-2b1 TaxID=2804670 RepID=UPI003CE9FD1D